MQRNIILLCILTTLLVVRPALAPCPAQAEVLLDAEAYLQSSHAAFACVDCHTDLPDTHPKGGSGNAHKSNELCVVCHFAAQEELRQGTHPGGENGDNAACVSCHNPHASGLQDTASLNAGQSACLSCHAGAGRFAVGIGVFDNKTCLQCHKPHPEGRFGDVHARLDCVSCHSKHSLQLLQNRISSGQALADWSHEQFAARPCTYCHIAGNGFGAPAAVLPRKGVTCIACHSASITVEDEPSFAGLMVFGLGVLGWLSLAFGVSKARTAQKLPRQTRMRFTPAKAVSTLFMDVILQRRLYRSSPARWRAHALISLGILGRFAFGLGLMLAAVLAPDSEQILALFDRANPLAASFYEFTGLCLGLGAVLLLRQGRAQQLRRGVRWGLWLMLAIALSGFGLEGLRITMQGVAAPWLPLGWALSALLALLPAPDSLYVWLWYAHASAMALFIAWLPFSGLAHIIAAPLIMLARSLRGHAQNHKQAG